MNILQSFIFPKDPSFGSEEKYLRRQGNVYSSGDALEMAKFSTVQFDTYYNAFSIPLWQQKVGIQEASLQIKGSGKIEIELWHFYKYKIEPGLYYHTKELIESQEITLSQENQEFCAINVADDLEFSGLVYPKIRAVSDVTIDSIQWTTTDEPQRPVKLGISITHFNRKAYVIPAMKRIKEQLLDIPEWHDKIDFVVVDNSQNITTEEAMGLTIIPNENTGGSGGFTRGLLHYKNETDATHVLFMDDDASVEIESVKRTYYILQYAKAANTAVGAALFYEEIPDKFIETGGSYYTPAGLVPSKPEKNIKNMDDEIAIDYLLENELKELQPNTFIGWWHCAFPIAYAKKFVPPFFVKMDDVYFPQINNFNIIFANGIASYAENFSSKVAAMTPYLEIRNNFVTNALYFKKSMPMFGFYARFYLRLLFSLRYGSVDVCRLAMKDFCHLDADKFVADANLSTRLFPIFKKLTKAETMQPIDLKDYDVIRADIDDESRWSKFLRTVLLNKLLLPYKSHKPIFQELYYRANFRTIARYKKVLYYNTSTKKGYIAEASRAKSIKYAFLLLGDFFKFIFMFPATRRRLRAKSDYLTSEEMWNKILKNSIDN